jgi:serine/threonine protein kinase
MPRGSQSKRDLRVRQKLGKYRIERRLGAGGFACVYQAMDTVQGIRVALKIPHSEYVTEALLSDFRKEIRTTSGLEHTNILMIKDASIIEDRLVVVLPLGIETLQERMSRRFCLETSIDISEQILRATALAHSQNVIHCDIKPENVILFPGNHIRLADFGIAKVSQKTIQGGGTGTVGYMAPEQAMGRPSFRSDVFSLGLIIWRLTAGLWPEWPFEWPFAGHQRLRGRVHPDFVLFMRKAIYLNPRHRYRDAQQMLSAFLRLKCRTLRYAEQKRAQQRARTSSNRRRSA